MKIVRMLAATCFGAAMLAAAGAASATNYFESISANPADFTCTVAGGLQTCGAYTVFENPQPVGGANQYNGGSGIFFANAGDTVTVRINYSSTLHVPTSSTVSLVYVDLYAYVPTDGTSYLPEKLSDVTSILTNYNGPADPYLFYQSTEYSASAGHHFDAGSIGAFSIDGITSGFDILQGNPDEIVLAAYGYQVGVPEPATWAMMLLGFGGVGGALRTRRGRHRVT
jgi:hypothetical protein